MCGSAPSLHEDLAKARELRPDAMLVGANFVGLLVPEIEHIWTQHNEYIHKIKNTTGRPIKVHARPKEYRPKGGGLWFNLSPDESWNQLDYVWPELYWVNGSSGVAGAMWAKHGMGFDEVIMAGIQLSSNSTTYTPEYAQTQFMGNGMNFAQQHNIEHWQACLLRHHEKGLTKGVYSMSGYTRALLGAPPGLED